MSGGKTKSNISKKAIVYMARLLVIALFFTSLPSIQLDSVSNTFSVTRTVPVAHAATAGPNTCATAADNATVGTVSWTSTASGCDDNNTYASVTVNGTAVSHYLLLTNFGFTTGDFPTDATIDGITVAVDWRGTNSGANDPIENSIRLFSGGSPVGTDKSTGAAVPLSTEQTSTYGATNDTWSSGLSPTNLHSSTFGVGFSITGDTGNGNKDVIAEIDTVRITITYSTESDPPTPNPPYFATPPAATTTDMIRMISTTVTDAASSPVQYYFEVNNTACGANAGTGGTNSGWQGSATYDDLGLQTNKCYGYQIGARDAVLNYTSTSTASTTYTRAATPGAVTFSGVTQNSITISNTENGNPASNPTTNFKVYATSTDSRWNEVYVTAAAGTSTSPVWLTDAQIDGLALTGLLGATRYDFQVVARNQLNLETSTSTLSGTTTIADAVGPTPDPATFSVAPDDVSTSEIDMTATGASDDNPPIEYYFTNTNAACGVDAGTGGTDRTWNTSTTHNDTGLDTNQCYGYTVTARDSLGNSNATSSVLTAYTAAAVPSAPTLNNETDTTIDVTNNENGNPATTTFKVFVASSTPADATWEEMYVDAGGNPSVTEVWLTDSQINGLTITNLNFNTTYAVEVVARNGDGDQTASSTQTEATTLQDQASPTPTPPYFSSPPQNDSASQISMTSVGITDPSGPVEYYFTATTSTCGADIGTGGDDRTWNSSASYSDNGLQANKCYGYMVTGRDAVGNRTATSTASTTYTSANIPGVLTFSNVGSSTIDITNDANGNPTADPITTFKVYATSTDGTWNERYVDASGNPSVGEVWLTDTQIDGLTINGLSELTRYDFVVVARNEDGDRTASSTLAGTTTIDLTPPTPDPTWFSSAPSNDTDDQISMTANTVTDPSAPVNYFFELNNTSCGANAGSGGSNSSWQASESYADNGLDPNKCYGYTVTARDGAGNYAATSTASTTYTSAAVPGAPSFSSVTGSSLVLSNAENGNPASNPTTAFKVFASSTDDGSWDGMYVNGSGDPSATEVWLTDAQIDGLTVNGLSELTEYEFLVVARNQDGDRTASSTVNSTTTLDLTAPTPNPPYFTSEPTNASASQIDMTSVTISDTSTPVEYLFTLNNTSCGVNAGTGGNSSSWQTSTSYSDTGLEPNHCYGYTITGRDAAQNETSESTASTTYTSANVPGAPTLSFVDATHLNIDNDENGNPTTNPATTFVVQIVTTSPADATWSNKYVDANGDPSDTEVWLTDAQIDSLVIQGLTAETLYGARVKARNQDGEETAYGAEGQETTAATAGPFDTRIQGGRFHGVRLQ